MIEKQTINGRTANVCYFDDNFQPRDKAVATLCKVLFQDNMETVTLRLREPDNGDIHGGG